MMNGSGLGWFSRRPQAAETAEGETVALQHDVKQLLDYVEELGLPPLVSMEPTDARAFMQASAAERPPGPEVAETVDGELDGAVGPLSYRLYRPTLDPDLPVFVYFHGGGWVLGSYESDDPLCRDLAVRSGALVISVDYRHAPEDPFPAAIEDGIAAVRWVADHGEELGGDTTRLAIGGWSAGANVAAVVCQIARDESGPPIAGQVLLTPVVDCDFSRESYEINSDGYVLTTELMHWFWDYYLPPDLTSEQRTDPRASPIRAESLAELPPAFVVTCEYDPLRDEGAEYAELLQAAGVEADHLRCDGQTHTSIGAVGVIQSGEPGRQALANAIRRFLDL